MTEKSQAHSDYRVLARKYRPQTFDALIGQDALVRTLKNAIDSRRIAHAYMLTGVRGVGKTTTARIIARALNYTGPDGTAGPTTGDTSDCAICQAIAQDRHPDVMEMDAASRTGIDDIREILDGVRYAPVSARYKVYIIDEIHMLSKQAFNALLKTLEEPPPNVIFIFATTEIRKVPVTILSRCQRFDLRRVPVDTLQAHFASICVKEGVEAEEEALAMIARAADGSVRDGLSLLDQAIALADTGRVSAESVVGMLGTTDSLRILDLLESAMKGEAAACLDATADLYSLGAEPRLVLQDMMEMVHGLSILAAVRDQRGESDVIPYAGMDKAKAMAESLTMPQLQKAWQVLSKGMQELNYVPDPRRAADMVVLRLCYLADLPDPADLIRRWKESPAAADMSPPSGVQAAGESGKNAPHLRSVPAGRSTGSRGASAAQPAVQATADAAAVPAPVTMEDLVALFEERGEMILASHLYRDAACVVLAPGRFEFVATPAAPADLASRVRGCLAQWTGMSWAVAVVNGGAHAPFSLADQKDRAEREHAAAITSHPNVTAVLEAFPGAEITRIINPNEEDENAWISPK